MLPKALIDYSMKLWLQCMLHCHTFQSSNTSVVSTYLFKYGLTAVSPEIFPEVFSACAGGPGTHTVWSHFGLSLLFWPLTILNWCGHNVSHALCPFPITGDSILSLAASFGDILTPKPRNTNGKIRSHSIPNCCRPSQRAAEQCDLIKVKYNPPSSLTQDRTLRTFCFNPRLWLPFHSNKHPPAAL